MQVNGPIVAAISVAALAVGGLAFAAGRVTTDHSQNQTLANSVPTGCSVTPSSCGFPDATNTGVQSAAVLTKITSASTSGVGWSCNSPCSKWRVTASIGSLTTGYELAAGISVWTAGQNVTITNLKVDGGAFTVCNGNSNGDCSSSTPAANVILSHCDIGGALAGSGFATNSAPTYGVLVQAYSSSGVPAHGFAMDHCHVHGFQNDLDFNENGPISLTADWFNDIRCNSPCTAHLNGIYDGGVAATVSPTSLTVQNNTIVNDASTNASGAFSFFSDGGALLKVNGGLDHNLIENLNNQCFSSDDQHASQPTGLAITNNDFVATGACGVNHGILRTFNGGGTAQAWPFGTTPNALGNMDCGNWWDNGAHPGAGADGSNSYPTSAVAVVACAGGSTTTTVPVTAPASTSTVTAAPTTTVAPTTSTSTSTTTTVPVTPTTETETVICHSPPLVCTVG